MFCGLTCLGVFGMGFWYCLCLCVVVYWCCWILLLGVGCV